MIKATELRIGNILHQGEVVRILEGAARVKYKLDGIEKYSIVHCEDLEPVLIDNEWMVKFGFEKVTWTDGGIKIESTWEHPNDNMPILGEDLSLDGIPGRRLRHVHQLQNLYHALTGEELEIQEAVTK